MQMPIIRTKLNRPVSTAGFVERKALNAMLDEGLGKNLLLVSAPAGSGKSTLLSEALATRNLNHFWYGLDSSDDDLQIFVTYCIEGLRRHPQLDSEWLNGLIAQFQDLGPQILVRVLISQLELTSTPFYMILDDYHHINQPTIHQMIMELIEYVPPVFHVVLITREDPALPLSKWRLRQRLVELRAEDLKFDADEAAAFMHSTMHLSLSPEEISTLNGQAEGWIAGLQMAAIYLSRYHAISRPVVQMTAPHHESINYLFEEVWAQLSEDMKTFLRSASLFDRFSASLCDAVLSASKGHGQRMLDALWQRNAFLIALDETRQWYRFHHLFAELLRRYAQPSAALAQRYHQYGGDWFHQQGLLMESMAHALRGNDLKRAADLIEGLWAEMDQSSLSQQWLSYARQLPDDIIRKRPVLNVGFAWALMDGGDIESPVERLQETQAQLEGEGMLFDAETYQVGDYGQFQVLGGHIQTAYAYIAAAKGDAEGVLTHANRALALFGTRHDLRVSIIRMLMSFAHWTRGEFQEAEGLIMEAMRCVLRGGGQWSLSSYQLMLAQLRIERGHLTSAESLLMKAIEALKDNGHLPLALSSLELKLAEIALLRGDYDRVETLLEESQVHGEVLALPDFPFKWRLLRAQLLAAREAYTDALDCLDEAQVLYHVNPIPEHITIDGLRAQLFLQMSCPERGLDWARREAHETEQDHMVHIRYERFRPQDQKGVRAIPSPRLQLTSLLERAQRQHRQRSQVDILLTMAELDAAEGNVEESILHMVRALGLAAEEGYLHPFLVRRSVLGEILLEAIRREGHATPFSSRLKAQCAGPAMHGTLRQKGVDALTPRERDILERIAKGYTNQEIADELYLALSTVKGYSSTLFEKLGVKRRTEAIAMARERHWLP